MQICFVAVVPKYLNFSILLKDLLQIRKLGSCPPSVTVRNTFVLNGDELLAPRSSPPAGAPPNVGWPVPFIQHSHSYSPYLEPISCFRNPRTRHAVVTGNPLNMEYIALTGIYVLVKLNRRKYKHT